MKKKELNYLRISTDFQLSKYSFLPSVLAPLARAPPFSPPPSLPQLNFLLLINSIGQKFLPSTHFSLFLVMVLIFTQQGLHQQEVATHEFVQPSLAVRHSEEPPPLTTTQFLRDIQNVFALDTADFPVQVQSLLLYPLFVGRANDLPSGLLLVVDSLLHPATDRLLADVEDLVEVQFVFEALFGLQNHLPQFLGKHVPKLNKLQGTEDVGHLLDGDLWVLDQLLEIVVYFFECFDLLVLFRPFLDSCEEELDVTFLCSSFRLSLGVVLALAIFLIDGTGFRTFYI